MENTQNNLWKKFLTIKGICTSDRYGNMPCDSYDVYCTRCQRDYIINDYEIWKKQQLDLEK